MTNLIPWYSNNGQRLALNWNNAAGATNITNLFGTDGERFLPVNDRGLYMPGVIRYLPTGGIFYAGLPKVQFRSPWISDGQIKRLTLTYAWQPVTVLYHVSDANGKETLTTGNGYLNLDLTQVANLTRRRNGYDGFLWDFTIVEVI